MFHAFIIGALIGLFIIITVAYHLWATIGPFEFSDEKPDPETVIRGLISRDDYAKLSNKEKKRLKKKSVQYIEEYLKIRFANPSPVSASAGTVETKNGKEAQSPASDNPFEGDSDLITPQLRTVYHRTNELLEEIKEQMTALTPREERFTEQITAEYYPEMFATLNKVIRTTMVGTQHQKDVVSECSKQLIIIQQGLMQIIEDSLAAEAIKAQTQTEFLISSVLGSESGGLSISKSNGLNNTNEEPLVDSSTSHTAGPTEAAKQGNGTTEKENS